MRDAGDYARALRPLLPRAAGYARSLLHDRADAEDAVQQAALRGWERIARYDATRPFAGWWFAILRNCCIDMLRRDRAGAAGRADDAGSVEPDMGGLDRHGLERALALLSEDHREMLRLRYFGELSYGEIAAALGIPSGTVMSRLHLARKALAARMREDDA